MCKEKTYIFRIRKQEAGNNENKKKGRSEKYMEKTVNCLNQFLADLAVFYRKLQNFHWNVEGKDFFVIHAKLEEYYDDINKQIDEIAEYILSIGGQPLGTMKDYMQITKIQEAENVKVKSDAVLSCLIKDYETILQEAKQIKQESDTNNDAQTSTMMDDYIEDYSKKLWMLRQTMA